MLDLLTPTTESVPGLRISNAYIRRAETGELILIDSGTPGNAKRIAGFLHERGIDVRSLSLVLLTHADIDHSGSVWELKEKFAPAAKVAIHAEDAPRVAGEKKLKEAKGAAGLMIGMMASIMKFHPFRPDIILNENDTIGDLRTVYTPGHTQGSVCFYSEKEKALFSGDTLVTDSKGSVNFAGKSISYDLELTRKSVAAKILALDFQVLLPGHGAPIASGACQKVKELYSIG